MTITLELAPEIDAYLREKADREGLNPEVVARSVLSDALEWEIRDRAAAAAGIRRGLEASAAGDVITLAEAVADARRCHGFPESWPGFEG